MRLLAAGAFTLALLTVHTGSTLAQAGGNVLIFLADDLGVDHVGAYGEGANPAPTPTIDALATNGILFRNVWANPTCSPTRSDIMTGRYGFRTGIGAPILPAGWALQMDEETIPEVLDRFEHLDYSHGAFGKWHLGNGSVGGNLAPNVAGWSFFAGTLGNIGVDNSYFDYEYTVNGQVGQSTTYATTQTIDDALAWIQTVPDPWVCYVAFNAPHTPLHAPPAHLHTVDLPDDEPRNQPIPFYHAMVEAMDSEMNRMMTTLGSRMDNTTVLFMGDNGTHNQAVQPPFDPDRAKFTPYEGGVNVPLILSGPGVVDPGRESGALVNATDVFATTLELAGILMRDAYPFPQPIRHDTVSLVPYMIEPNQGWQRDFAYANVFFPNDASGSGIDFDWQVIRDDRFKLIRRKQVGGPPAWLEMYDLMVDPFENDDLLDEPMTPSQRMSYITLWNRLLEIREL
ncbi:MAG: sulfatase-like hydrolase/transferase [bacterium]|nr:sulfatase-like hydrolase/transferase [bacterium]